MKQKKKSCNKIFEVYVCRDKEETIIYIGSGLVGRHKHCESGVSNVYGLNDLHFKGEKVHVKIEHTFGTKDESLAKEKELILQFKPKFNKQYLEDKKIDLMNIGAVQSTKLREIVRNTCLKYYRNVKVKQAADFIDFAEVLIKSYKVSGLITGVHLTGVLGFNTDSGLGRKYTKYKTQTSYKMFSDIFVKDGNSIRLKPEITTVLST